MFNFLDKFRAPDLKMRSFLSCIAAWTQKVAVPPTQMSHVPKQHKQPASATGSAQRAPKPWSSNFNNEHTKNPYDKVLVQKSEEKPLEGPQSKRNFASNSPGSRLLRSRVPGSTPTIDLDDFSDACPNTSSAPLVTHTASQLAHAANLSSSESDDDENEHNTQAVAKTSPRKSSRANKKLRRASSSLSLDSCDSEALNPEPSSTKKNCGPSMSAAQPGRLGTSQVIGLRTAQGAAGGSIAGQRPEASIKKQKFRSGASATNGGTVKDVGSRAKALLLQQQQGNIMRNGNSNSSRATKPANAKSSSSNPPPPVGKCLLCNTHGVLLSGESICRFNCRSSANRASAPAANVSNPSGTKSTAKITTGNASRGNQNSMEPCLPSSLPRSSVPVSKATSAPPIQSGSKGNVLGKRGANGEPKPPVAQALQNVASYSLPRKKIPLINMPVIMENDVAAKDRFRFFSHRAKRFDFPRDSAMAKFSPFASAAESMEGVSSTDVCSVCGSSGNLVTCERCPLAFHKHCHSPPMKDGEAEAFFCRACKSVKGNDKSKDYLPAVRLEVLPPPWKPLERLAADAARGNPVDMVLHPALHNDFIRHYKTDWLRCNRCHRLRVVGQRSLSESVHIPFECTDAFWATADQRSCSAVLSALEQSQLQYAYSRMRERSKRRLRLFYHKFGEKDRTSYGFLSPDEVVVLDDADDAAPPDPSRKRTVGLCSTPSPKPPVIASGSQTADAPVAAAPSTPKPQAAGPVQSSSHVQPASTPGQPPVPNTVRAESTMKVGSRNFLAKSADNGPLKSNRTVPAGRPSSTAEGVQHFNAPVISARRSQPSDAPGQQQRQLNGLGVSVPSNAAVPSYARMASPVSQVRTTAISNGEQNTALLAGAVAPSGPIQEQRGPTATGFSLPNNGSRSTQSGTPVQNIPIVSNPVGASESAQHLRGPHGPRVSVRNSYSLSASNSTQAVPSNPVQNVVLVSSPAAPTVSTPGMPMINVASPVQHMPAIALNVQPGNNVGQRQQQRGRAIRETNLARLQPVQSARHQGNFLPAQHMINSQNRRVSEGSPPDAVYDVGQIDMVQLGSRRVPPANYGGSSPNQNQVAREGPAWNGNEHSKPATSTPESFQQVLLNRIADIGESAEVEDTLVDLALANNPTLIQIFNAFRGNPSRFGRQAARLARSLMANSPAHQHCPAPVHGSNEASGNNGQVAVVQHQQQLDMANGSGGPVNHGIQAGYVGSVEQFRTLTPAEKHSLNEKFRQLRILQMQQCVRLEDCMAREMRAIPTQSVPQLHAAHNKAKKRMISTHADQLRNLVYSISGAQGIAPLRHQYHQQ